ncbi:hypothetical protein AAFN87_08050 [Solibacillus sp. CAU 1738]
MKQIRSNVKALSHLAVEVGVFGSDDAFYAMIAGVHEYGITIRKEKGSIVIPERSFLRSTFDEKQSVWLEFVRKRIPSLVDGQMDARQLLELLGTKMVSDIQKKIKDLDDPPNAPSTIAQKGSSSPLIDTGGLRKRITYKVVSV